MTQEEIVKILEVYEMALNGILDILADFDKQLMIIDKRLSELKNILIRLEKND